MKSSRETSIKLHTPLQKQLQCLIQVYKLLKKIFDGQLLVAPLQQGEAVDGEK